MSAAQQGQPYLWSCHPYPSLDPCQGRLQDVGAARHPSHCWQAGDWAQDPNHLGKALWGMKLGLLGIEQACLQKNHHTQGLQIMVCQKRANLCSMCHLGFMKARYISATHAVLCVTLLRFSRGHSDTLYSLEQKHCQHSRCSCHCSIHAHFLARKMHVSCTEFQLASLWHKS